MSRYKAPRGAPDLVPPDSELLSEIETRAREIFDRYGYRRIETPVFEHTEVFTRSIGESSDIVRKEMYTFTDRKGRSLTLRPEGTAGVVRAFVEHRLDGRLPMPVRLWYFGPMFRYERPQKGRNRQFFQLGMECLGSAAPVVDAEVIAMGDELYSSVGLEPELIVNSMGCEADRDKYRPLLRAALEPQLPELCEDCRERLATNPLRVFDCKIERCREIIAAADVPPLVETICPDCREHFEGVRGLLDGMGVEHTLEPRLVRGFDYYTRTVWEFDLTELGARSAIGGGGRYDGLVEEFGGPPLPGVGMAPGVEPMMVALRGDERAGYRPELYVVWLGEAGPKAMALATELRRAGRRVVVSDEAKSIRAQLRAADRLGAGRAVILGPDEVARGVAAVRDLESGDQREVALTEIGDF